MLQPADIRHAFPMRISEAGEQVFLLCHELAPAVGKHVLWCGSVILTGTEALSCSEGGAFTLRI